MINPKNICISGFVGFFLSFFIGLVSDVRFSRVLTRAFLFALLFAIVCVGITILYQKFLSNDNGGFSAEAEASPQRAAGGVVNIVVDDSNLSDDGMSPKFTVLNNHTGLSAEPAPEAPSPAEAAPVKSEPVSSADGPVSFSPVEEVQVAAPAAAATPVQEESASFKPAGLNEVAQGGTPFVPPPLSSVPSADETPLDELPDIGSMGTVSEEESSHESFTATDGIETDTEFSTGGKHVKEQPVSGDTNVMAKAIQTLLAKDN